MFSKILIIEDIDSISLGISTVLKQNFNSTIHTSKYCDDGYLKIKKAIAEQHPYDLIITDLSFKDDLKKNIKLATGEELIARLKQEDIHTKIIVYAMDEKPFVLKSLLSTPFINAYVIKGRESITELIDAVNAVAQGFSYISAEFESTLKHQSLFEMDKFDTLILRFLSEGHTQEDISKIFKEKKYPSASMSSIEKKINRLKLVLKANNSIQLVAIAKDMKII